MKRFLICILLFSSFVLAAIAVFEWSLRNIPNEFRFKDEVMQQRAESLTTLVIGSSVAHEGIDPAIFPDSATAFNLALSGEMTTYNCMSFFHYAPRLTHLRHLIWGFSYQQLYFDDRIPENMMNRYGHRIYMGIDEQPGITEHLECLALKSLAFRKFTKYYFKGETDEPFAPSGLDSRPYEEGLRLNWKEKTKKQADDYTKEMRLRTKDRDMNIQLIHEVLDYCRKKNIQVSIVVPPVYPTYNDACDAALKAYNVNFFKSLEKKYANLKVFYYFGDKRYEEKDYYDYGHLSSDHGAQKFTRRLLADIAKGESIYIE